VTIAAYRWDFGDGGTSNGASPTTTHVFAAAGTYVVRLTVTDSNGRTGTTTNNVTVTVAPAPTASFTVSPTSPAAGQVVNFNGSGSTAPAGSTITAYAWNFGDGGTASNGPTTSHRFTTAGTYVVRLTVTDSAGRTGTTTNSVTVTAATQNAPTASFVFSPGSPGAVVYNATQSTPGSGRTIAAYSWNFGDGTTGTGVTASKVFSQAGTYNVTLTVTDDIGQTGTATRAVTVAGPGSGGVFPSFTFSPNNPAVNQLIFFNASSSTAPSAITSYVWDFGDGTSATGVTPAGKSYTVKGNYVVRLTITDSAGRTGSTTQTVPVQ
jgi:PKD repeat protein